MRTIEMKMMALAFVLALSGMAQAGTVLLSDNYNGITVSTADTSENLAARQGGTLATKAYTASGWSWYLVPNEGVSGTSALSCSVNGAWSALAPEVNWFSGGITDGGFTVSFDLKTGSVATPSQPGWSDVGFTFGADSAWLDNRPVSTFAVKLSGDSVLHVSALGNAGIDMAVPESILGVYHNIQVSYVGNSLANGTAAELRMAVDGQLIDLNGPAGGTAYSFSVENAGDASLNYLHLTSGAWAADFDNLEIRTGVIPEPASLALLGLGAAAWCVRRRRQG
jgi:hypothetical protein